MTSPKTSIRKNSGRVLRLLALVLFLVLILFETAGFPAWVTRAVTERLSRSSYLVKAGSMRLDLLTGLYFKDVVVYRKKVVGPPAVQCRGMRVRCNPYGFISSDSDRFSVEFIDGRIISAQAAGEGSQEGSDLSGLLVFLTDMNVDNIDVSRMSAELTASGGRLCATNIVCAVGGEYGRGQANGSVVFESDGGISGKVVTEMDPHILLPFLEPLGWEYLCAVIKRFEWEEEKPLVDTQFSVSGDGETRRYLSESLFSMEDYSYRGVSNDTCNGVLSVNYSATSHVVSVENITIDIDDEAIVGGFAFDGFSRTVKYKAVSDVSPKDFFQMVGLFKKSKMTAWSFPGKTRFVSEGVVDFNKADGDTTAVLAEVESFGMGIEPLIADSCRFNVMMNGSTCRITNIHGTIWDGHFDARAEIVFEKDQDVVTFGCRMDDGDFSKVTQAFSTQAVDMSGKFYIEMDGRFLLASNILETMTATGRLSVDDGKVFQLPVFGGLTKIMSKLIPGLDFVIAQSDLVSEFAIENGRISSDKISINGDVLSLDAKGTASFEGDLDYAVQLKLMSDHSVVAKVLRAVTWPISKLFEFRLKGTRDEPQWYPINFSTELLERVGLKKEGQPANKRD